MKRRVKKLALSRETLRRLDRANLQRVHGARTVGCGGTADSDCGVCYTADVTDCPGCIYTNNAMCLSETCGGTCLHSQLEDNTACHC